MKVGDGMLPYDNSDEKSILDYAVKLEGMTFEEVFIESQNWDFAINNRIDWNKPSNKGKLGNLLEERYFGYAANSIQEPDFPNAGVELKVSPIDITQKGEETAGERLVLTMISFNEAVEDDFYKSHVWDKCKRILLIYYLRIEAERYKNKIKYVNLFTPENKDRAIIIRDYAIIKDYIKRGKAEELSESLTCYLGACTKGVDSKHTVTQYYPPHSETKTRAYCFKRQYMQYVIDTYIHHKKSKYEVILSDEDMNLLEEKSFDDIVIEKIKPYIGMTDSELCEKFNITYDKNAKNNKAIWNTLVYRILGITGNHAEEFVKANVRVKVSRIEEDNTMTESVSFPVYDFKKLAAQSWDDSEIHDYFSETRFLWVTFKDQNGEYRLDKAQFWHMPYVDLENVVRNEWEHIQRVIRYGVEFTVRNGVVRNNIPGIKETKILHSRPKAKKAAYSLSNGFVVGDVASDANELPDGQFMTKQCFWIKNKYIAEQLGYLASD